VPTVSEPTALTLFGVSLLVAAAGYRRRGRG
jgi:MYXO-CTERM domain-containing protein